VILTAAPEQVPPALIDQLKPGGHLVTPVGPPMLGQQLVVLYKDAESRISRTNILPVAFVPLTRQQEH
jgi:protein-L-isoaspartate(D-aspartate) O-methyltransferase